MNDPATPIPATGYTAWFLGRDGEPFGLPVVALVPHPVLYTEVDEDPTTEWEPAVITAAGTLLEVYEADGVPALVGGVLVGVAPASMSPGTALDWLENHKVMRPGSDHPRLGTVDDEDMVGKVTAARHRLPRRLSAAR